MSAWPRKPARRAGRPDSSSGQANSRRRSWKWRSIAGASRVTRGASRAAEWACIREPGAPRPPTAAGPRPGRRPRRRTHRRRGVHVAVRRVATHVSPRGGRPDGKYARLPGLRLPRRQDEPARLALLVAVNLAHCNDSSSPIRSRSRGPHDQRPQMGVACSAPALLVQPPGPAGGSAPLRCRSASRRTPPRRNGDVRE